jgi:hypothetical protein
MGFGRRLVRKTARRAVRKSVRRVTPRPVRKAMHPARTVKNAVTPRPVRQVSRAVYTVRNPLGAAENRLMGAALNAGRGRRRSTGRGLFWISFGRRRGRRRRSNPPAASTQRRPGTPPSAAPARYPVPARQHSAAPVSLAAQISRWLNGPGGATQRAIQADLTVLTTLSDAVSKLIRVQAGEHDIELALSKLQLAWARLSSDVTAALAAPPIPDAQAQCWWAKWLTELQKAAVDGQVAAETRDRRMVLQAALGMDAATENVREMTKRFNVIRDAAQTPRQP